MTKRKHTKNNHCSDCKRDDLPQVPGTSLCLVSHVSPTGEPCMDGRTACDPGDSCSEWAVKFMAECDKRTVAGWQMLNLLELDL